MTLPAVSVVIPALDEERSVAAAIRSARAAGADEVIVADGGSGDGTVAAARPLADLVLSSSRGRARQMNAGAAAASGEILLFLHADTVLPAGSVDLLRDAVGRNGTVGGAFPVRLAPSPSSPAAMRTLLRIVSRMINARSRVARSHTGDQGIFVRRAVFDGIGGYADVPLMEDVLFSCALRRRGRTVLLPCRVTTSARRWEEWGPVRTILLMWGLRAAFLLGMSPARCAEVWRRGPRR